MATPTAAATTAATANPFDVSIIFDPVYLSQPVPWENRETTILGIIITAVSLSAFCVLVRLYVRVIVVRAPGWDDMCVAMYLLLNLISAVSICMAPGNGLGKHIVLITPIQLRNFLLEFYIANATYVSSTAFIKLSLLFQYLRLYDRGSAIWRFCIVLIVIVSLWGTAFSVMAWLPCFPVRRFYDSAVEVVDGTCYGFGAPFDKSTFILHTAANMFFDLLVFAIPITLPFDKTTPLKQRIGMALLLLLGVMVNVFAAWRLVGLIQAREDIFALLDGTYRSAIAVILASLETNLASICASVPIFWPVLSTQITRIFVTKEIDMVYEERFELHSRAGSQGDFAAAGAGGPFGSGEGGGGVEGLGLKRWRDSDTRGHYDDSYIRDQVDPLRPATAAGGVETRVKGDRAPGRRRKRFGVF